MDWIRAAGGITGDHTGAKRLASAIDATVVTFAILTAIGVGLGGRAVCGLLLGELVIGRHRCSTWLPTLQER
ncbi:hypothetical protein [Salinarchaeum laminariae]|uniref:hypothetical protein n=1 Tax=Salinarchaeum laminariae TaxID=869888 RepID=UPI0020C070F5|nr:hypothetical protein [Salinarchaeum laminariae]